jgi:hypothetical protein
MRTIERVRSELARGNLWRAREILQGSLENFGYNLELYEEYGKVLLRMGDLPAAGKFLFLSGARTPEYDNAIGLYLKRHKSSPAQLFKSFPRTARLIVLSTYPTAVEHDLRELGLPNNLSLFPGVVVHDHVEDDKSWVGRLPGIVLVLFVLFILMLLILGFIKLREITIWFWS